MRLSLILANSRFHGRCEGHAKLLFHYSHSRIKFCKYEIGLKCDCTVIFHPKKSLNDTSLIVQQEHDAFVFTDVCEKINVLFLTEGWMWEWRVNFSDVLSYGEYEDYHSFDVVIV